MRLSEFILSNRPAIIAEWEEFARSLNPGSGMTALELKDHVDQILSFIAKDLERPQSEQQQFAKSRGLGISEAGAPSSAAEIHGTLRHDDGYDIVEMVSEYRALRASITKLWGSAHKAFSQSDLHDLTRFNEAIDQALAESVVTFNTKVDQSKNLILGVLGHDIRSPLATIHMSAQLLKHGNVPAERQATLLTQIESSTARVRSIVTDLLDLTKAQLGTGLPIKRSSMSLSALCTGIVDEMQIQHPQRAILTEIEANVDGNWDNIRLGQVLSNLLSNAIQYGREKTPIRVMLATSPGGIQISVHNEGTPIPRTHLESIFQSFTRAPGTKEDKATASQNLGLGLFISREIINSHGGTIKAESSLTQGTTFSINLPN